jgi:hypothetical protein
LNETISQLQDAKTNIASAQQSIKSAQKSVDSVQSDEGLFLISVLVSIGLALVSLLVVVIRARKSRSGQ